MSEEHDYRIVRYGGGDYGGLADLAFTSSSHGFRTPEEFIAAANEAATKPVVEWEGQGFREVKMKWVMIGHEDDLDFAIISVVQGGHCDYPNGMTVEWKWGVPGNNTFSWARFNKLFKQVPE